MVVIKAVRQRKKPADLNGEVRRHHHRLHLLNLGEITRKGRPHQHPLQSLGNQVLNGNDQSVPLQSLESLAQKEKAR